MTQSFPPISTYESACHGPSLSPNSSVSSVNHHPYGDLSLLFFGHHFRRFHKSLNPFLFFILTGVQACSALVGMQRLGPILNSAIRPGTFGFQCSFTKQTCQPGCVGLPWLLSMSMFEFLCSMFREGPHFNSLFQQCHRFLCLEERGLT